MLPNGCIFMQTIIFDSEGRIYEMSIFSRKTYSSHLSEIPLSEMHCHLMSGVDDGAEDYIQSENMLGMMANDNVRTIILTPHHKGDRHCVSPEGIIKRTALLNDYSDEKHLGIKLYPGSELFYDSELGDRLESGEAVTMAGSKYILVEFHPMDEYKYISNGLISLLELGYMPILAHAERYMCMVDDTSLNKSIDLTENGIYLQCNTGSITGKFGRKTATFCKKLLCKELVTFIGTDAHSDVGNRVPDMKSCLIYMQKRLGLHESYIEELMAKNTISIIENTRI